MKKALLFLIGISFLTITSCRREVEKEGFVQVEGGKIWYQVTGKGTGTPLLVMHGGPGSRSCPMIPTFSQLGEDRPVIFYDQLGSGSSERPTQTSLWTIERFVDEIDLLRDHLDLEEVHILGHSAGGAFLMEYLATKKPKGIKSVIFSSPLLSTSDWIADAKLLLSEMPTAIQDTILKYEATKEYNAPPYLVAVDSFYTRHLSRKSWPYQPNVECENVGEFNGQVYNHMWGPTEFTAIGTLIDFDRTDYLSQIKEPILFITGEYDEARPETIYKYQKLTKNAQVKVIDNAAHATYIDQPEAVLKTLHDFLEGVEKP